MTTWEFQTPFLTLGDVKTQTRTKISEDSDIDDEIELWTNNVVQFICTEFPPDSLLNAGDTLLTTAVLTNIFDLPADVMYLVNVRDATTPWEDITGVSAQVMAKRYDITSPRPERRPRYYTQVGRPLDVLIQDALSALPPLRIKFDSNPSIGSTFQLLYYRLHTKLTDDDQPILLPPQYHALVIDGVMLEAAELTGVNTADYERKERKWERRLRRAYRARNVQPDRDLVMGDEPDESGTPFGPVFPSGYPWPR